MVTPQPIWTPLSAFAPRLAGNLAALAGRDVDLAGRLRAFVPAEPVFVRPTNGGLALGVGHPAVRDLPIRVPATTALNTAMSLCPSGHCETPLLVAGECQGWLWDRLHRLPCKSDVPGWRPPLYFVLPDLERLWALLHLHDWRDLLADLRVRLFAGPDAVDRLNAAMATDLACPLPHRWATVDPQVWPAGTDFEALRDAAVARREADFQRHLDAAKAYVPQRPTFGTKLRVLGLTSRYTTFLQHSMRDWLAAFDRLGHVTRLVIDPADHEVCGEQYRARVCAEFQPDLIVVIDHGRRTVGGLPPAVPVVMWVQDHMDHIYSAESGAAQGDRDFCLGFGRLQLSQRYGYPADRFLSACVGVNDDRFAPTPLSAAERDRFACDVSYVSHASTPADLLLAERLPLLESTDGARLYRDGFDRMVAHYEAGGGAMLEPNVRAMLRAAMDATGVQCQGKAEAIAIQFFQATIGNALFRHQTLQWVSDLGVDLRLYGRGWEQHPTLARHARGTADNAAQLSAIYRASRINLQAIVTGAVHQRLLDGLAAGGFFLVRRTPVDELGRHYLTLWDWCQRHGIASEAEFRRRADPTVRRVCHTLNGILGYDAATLDLPLFEILQTCADADFHEHRHRGLARVRPRRVRHGCRVEVARGAAPHRRCRSPRPGNGHARARDRAGQLPADHRSPARPDRRPAERVVAPVATGGRLSPTIPIQYRDAPRYGWPFYAARRALRGTAHAMLAAADGLSTREKYTLASHFRGPLLPENAALRDRHRGRRCFIIGNGPSLARQDLAPLAGEITIAMNGFVRHPLLDVVRPTYYLFADGTFFDGSEPSLKLLADVREQVKHSEFIAPYSAARDIVDQGWLDANRTRFIALAGNLRSARLRRVDLCRAVPNVMNCMQLSVMLALYAGCSEIYLLGADHDFLAHQGTHRHFYAGQTLAGHQVANDDYGRYRYLEMIRIVTDVWLGYGALRRYADGRGVKILNSTDGGFLDVFPRQRFEDVLPPASVRRAA